MRIAAVLIGIVVALVAGYLLFVFNWSYSEGERAGWIQKFSSKGWLCKTWEGEMAMVSMPGSMSEKFFFTVWDDATAEQISKLMGNSPEICRRHYAALIPEDMTEVVEFARCQPVPAPMPITKTA